MIKKHIICPERLRRIPKHFSWVDHRLVRDCYLHQCSSQALALYLFLTTVGDADGLSYYSDTSICKQLNWAADILCHARKELIKQALIAYQDPLYQVLDLPQNHRPTDEPLRRQKAPILNRNYNPPQHNNALNSQSSQHPQRDSKTRHIGAIIREMERTLKS